MAFAKVKTGTAQRGYGIDHQKTRAQLLPTAYGTPCVRCGKPMLQGQELHLDHNDTRTGYIGFSHAACNRKAGARKARAKQVRLAQAVQANGGRCPICGKSIKPGRIYCSQRCGWVAHKDQPPRAKAPRVKRAPSPHLCTDCGNPTTNKRCFICEPANPGGHDGKQMTREQRKQRAQQAASMREDGVEWQTIATQLGYYNGGSAYNCAKPFLADRW